MRRRCRWQRRNAHPPMQTIEELRKLMEDLFRSTLFGRPHWFYFIHGLNDLATRVNDDE